MPQPNKSLLGRIKSLDLAILIGIVAVVVIVSIPRLSEFARHENEADAARLARRMARLFDLEEVRNSPPANTLELFERLPRDARRQFEDNSSLAQGRVLLRHGYYFEFVRPPTFEGDTQGLLAVRAWPERPSRSPSACFLAFSGTVLLRHVGLDPAPAGLDAPPEIGAPQPLALKARGWQMVAPGAGE
jgi:hypothetical protein